MEIKKDEEKRREIENYIKKLELELENINGNNILYTIYLNEIII